MNAELPLTTMDTALKELGVSTDTLTADERNALDEHGYVVFPNLISAHWLQQLRTAFDALLRKEGSAAGTEVHQEEGTARLSDLMNKGEVFDGCYTHPKVLAAVHHIISADFKVSAMNGREALEGGGRQALHEDWNDSFFELGAVAKDGQYRQPNDPFYVAISLWLLDDVTETNGATRVVPGSHHRRAPQFELEDRFADHPEQVLLTGKAGTVIVMNSHLWHGGTTNTSGARRRVLHPYYVARQFRQQQNQREYIRKSTYDRISPAARYLLDVD
ncbi:phytanoyl-CoA dioxygenase family protein [Alicyclobacillus cycloheptanicus]|uniref:Ectoine hydroxylase-related dioxygenase (Phytanoyl-CoA dioxygenase family) n=1 Tax=Alicyclobacillus cycloheptanicus TaxID=1457 RepID=A0ABT9XHU9_9BACL|nr:phytanoyl-CoA dioxygenase family protein [Alicyclobacillus cycloheptanicus]MDQ0189893.1 ectoine hydroxylase-related dioxygenase (phytanoyl-CoA dioxygenase family) [Alicyclobacillus cycloheptanicus]WDM02203.1 phytanoyl-CoA dioxygenase family protein [Alicyclobacillus cycloheptanicus]